MNTVKRYYLRAVDCLIEGEELGRLGVYLAADYDQLKKENERLRRVTHVSLPTSTMEYEFSNYHRRGFNAGIRQGEAERDQLKAELDRLRDVQILLNTERALVEQLEERIDEAREVIKEQRYACTDLSEAMADAWLEANKCTTSALNNY